MLSRTIRIAIGRSRAVGIINSPSCQLLLSSKFSSDKIKSPKQPESPDKTDSSKLIKSKFPLIDFVKDLNAERFLPTNFKTVQHGDYQYQACLEDYIQIYSSGYQMPRPPNACGGYSVYYGEDHPLNEFGQIDRRQALHHAKMFGFLRALKSIQSGLFSKVCLNVDDMGLGGFVSYRLPVMSENAFRSPFSGKLNKDLETIMEINTLLRTRQDLQIRIQYTPNDIYFPPSYHANIIAKNAANDAQRQRQKTHFYGHL